MRDRDDVYLESSANDAFFWGPLILTSASDNPGESATEERIHSGDKSLPWGSVIDLECEKKVSTPFISFGIKLS